MLTFLPLMLFFQYAPRQRRQGRPRGVDQTARFTDEDDQFQTPGFVPHGRFQFQRDGCLLRSAARLHAGRAGERRRFGRLSELERLRRFDRQTGPCFLLSILPPNFLAKYLAAYKRRHPDVRLVFDIFDLWPETFPSSKMKRLLALPFSVWSGLRDHHLAEADRVLTECHMFQERLSLSDEQAHTVFLAAQRPEGLEDAQELNAERIELCYLGAINNIVNIPAIAALTCLALIISAALIALM